MTAKVTPSSRGRLLALGPVIVAAALLAPAATAWADPSAEAVEAIDADYAEFGGAESLLGAPVAEAVDAPGGALRDYEGGAIYYSKDTGAHVMYGAILDRYRELGGPSGALGYPTNDESDTGDGVGRFNNFAAPGGASVFWTPDSGAWVISGRVLEVWRNSGGITGPFGYPTADTAVADGVQTGTFTGPDGTQIQWSTADGLVTVPAELATTIPGLTPAAETPPPAPTPAATTPPTSPPASPSSAKSATSSTWWWIPVGIVVALLLLGLLRLLVRRRPAAPDDKPAPESAPIPPLPDAMSEPTTVIPAPEVRKAPLREVPTTIPPRATPQYVAPRPPGTHGTPVAPSPPLPPLPTPPRVPPAAPPRVAPPPAAEPKQPLTVPPAPRTSPPVAPPIPPAPTPPPPAVPPAPPAGTAPAPPAAPVRLVTADPPKAPRTGPVSVSADASPVIRYETQPPAESAIQVTYENNAIGDDQESAADKSDARD